MLIKILILFLFFNLVLYICKSRLSKKEPFRSGRNKFFILYHKSKETLSIDALPESISTVGYKNDDEKTLFKQLYKLRNKENEDRVQDIYR